MSPREIELKLDGTNTPALMPKTELSLDPAERTLLSQYISVGDPVRGFVRLLATQSSPLIVTKIPPDEDPWIKSASELVVGRQLTVRVQSVRGPWLEAATAGGVLCSMNLRELAWEGQPHPSHAIGDELEVVISQLLPAQRFVSVRCAGVPVPSAVEVAAGS